MLARVLINEFFFGKKYEWILEGPDPKEALPKVLAISKRYINATYIGKYTKWNVRLTDSYDDFMDEDEESLDVAAYDLSRYKPKVRNGEEIYDVAIDDFDKVHAAVKKANEEIEKVAPGYKLSLSSDSEVLGPGGFTISRNSKRVQVQK